jgi:hypothetical protein
MRWRCNGRVIVRGPLGFLRLPSSPLGQLLLGHSLGGNCPVPPDASSARLGRVHARKRVLLRLWRCRTWRVLRSGAFGKRMEAL